MDKIKSPLSRRAFVGGSASLFALGALSSIGLSACASANETTYKMQKAKWIWINNETDEYDSYGEFIENFECDSDEGINLEIACDGIYSVYINGNLVAFAQCSDFPMYKLYDRIDVSKYCKRGSTNNVQICVWHGPGENASVYKHDEAGVIFQIKSDDKVLAFSSIDTQSRKMSEYKNGYKKVITGQMGFSFLYDSNSGTKSLNNSVEVKKAEELHHRDIAKLELLNMVQASVVKETSNSIIYDLGEETVGFLNFNIISESQKLIIAYGEHLADGNVRKRIGTRDFTIEYIASDGQNKYTNYFRRLGARYLELFYEKSKPVVSEIGILPVNYPVKLKDFKLKDSELQKIYDASIKTLKSCMHEHYEDCPWREQALYGMDSRNQMLCGYYAFEGFEYQKHNLLLLSKSLRKDGLLEICAPSDTKKPIVFFSLCFILAVHEYVEHTNDKDFLKVVEPTIETILKTIANNIKDNLVQAFEDPPFWNFFEWTDESDGEDNVASCYLMMNCMYCYIHDIYKAMSGKTFADTDKIRKAIKEKFYVNNKYVLHDKTDRDSQLGNSLVVLAGAEGESLVDKIVEDLKTCWKKPSGSMIKASLSMKTFVYDALLKFGDKYKDVVLQDIRYTFTKMINDQYFTGTFWETEIGQSDFDNAGSLCHGWSAISAYYLPKYFANN